MADKVNAPSHYKGKGYEVIDIIEFFDLNFHRGNILKYVLRAGKKQEAGYDELEKEMEDLQKAAWYLAREMKRIAKSMEDMTPTEDKD
jgi:hypothetical protein